MTETTQELLRRSDATDFGDPHRPVSSNSRWSDLVWRLDTEDAGYPVNGVAVYWWTAADRGAVPPEALRLVEHFKRLLWTGLADPRARFVNKTTAAPTVARYFMDLVRFMLEEGLRSFADLTPHATERYCAWVGADLERRNPTRSEDTKWLAKNVFPRLASLTHIWESRCRLSQAGVPVPAVDPLAGMSAKRRAEYVIDLMEVAVPPVPDDVFLRIMNTAAEFVLEHAEDVLEAQATWFAHTGGFGSPSERKTATRVLAACRFGSTGSERLEWPTGLGDRDIKTFTDWPAANLANLIRALRDACAIILLATTGLRSGEFVSIAGGWSTSEDLPDCVVRERSSDDLFDVYLVKSKLLKGQVAPVEERWVVGMAPAGIDSMPLGVIAIRILERLMAPWRPLSTDRLAEHALYLQLTGRCLPLSGVSIRRPKHDVLNLSLKAFYGNWVRFDDLPDHSSDLSHDDLREIKASKGACITVRQLRKNFAQFNLRVDSGLLPALQAQLKHMRLSTTQMSYTGNDPRRLGGADDERRLESARDIATMLGVAPGIGGKLPDLISAHEERFGLRCDERDVDQITPPEAAQLGIVLLRVDHGLCGIRFAPQLSRCNKLAGTAGPLNIVPDLAHRTPSVCAGCPLFAANADHATFWRKRHAENEATWTAAQEKGLEADYRVAFQRMKQAEAILRAIGSKS